MKDRINIIGAGWAGLTAGYLLELCGYDVHVFEKDAFLGGHSRSIEVQGITVDSHGIHIFHTDEQWMWKWVSSFTAMRWYVHHAAAVTDYGTFKWPMTMEAVERHPLREKIEDELRTIESGTTWVGSSAFEQSLLDRIGPTLYKTFVEGYTKKMWGSTDLDASFAPSRIPLRLDNNANYFLDKYQGVPEDGYNAIFVGLAERLTVHQKTRGEIQKGVPTIVTAPPDELLEEKYGRLPYRSLTFKFDVEERPEGNHALIAPQVNYCSMDVPYTRKTEARQYTGQHIQKTVVVTETPGGNGRYYPVPTPEAKAMYQQYADEIEGMGSVWLLGRLGTFRYQNQNQVIDDAFTLVANITGKKREALIQMALADRCMRMAA